ncbi:MAG: hydroxymethylbilane synthase [Anaerolineae bacterium]|nr:hydroxymethylbilane synthase [Anaerolineae bacterium]
MNKLIIGTRGSKLSLTQTNLIATQLQQIHPDLTITIEVISTKGDRILDLPLSKVGDKGLFVKEIEQALLDGHIDLAVHSAKDLPSHLPDQLTLAAFPARTAAQDVLIMPADTQPNEKHHHLYDVLAPHTRVGTSSLRRTSQLLAVRPDLRISTMRGNIDTRLRKLAQGEHDAIVLAAAGLARLGLGQMDCEVSEFTLDHTRFRAYFIPNEIMLPAVGQGALAIETRADDHSTIALVRSIDDAQTRMCVLAERAFLRRIGGGCQLPNAAYAEFRAGQLAIQGLIASLDGQTILRAEVTSAGQMTTQTPESLGDQLGQQLLSHPLAQFTTLISHATQIKPKSAQPLHGKRIVITRPEERTDAFAQKLTDFGAEVIRYPVIAYAALQDTSNFDAAMRAMINGDYDWVAVTSVQSVRCMAAWLRQNRTALPALRIAAVGEATAHECRELLNVASVLVPEHHDAAHLAIAMSSLPTGDLATTQPSRNGLIGSRILLLNADIARPTLQHQLQRNGAMVDRVVAYHTIPNPQKPSATLSHALLNGDIAAITFTSGSTVRSFIQQVGPVSSNVAKNTKMVCIGPMTAQIAMENGITDPIVADTTTDDGMVEALIQTLMS